MAVPVSSEHLVKWKPDKRLVLSSLAALLLVGSYAYFQHSYLLYNFSFFLGLVILPFVIKRRPGEGRSFYFLFALTSFGMFFLMPTKSGLFFSTGLTLLYLLEKQMGRINWLPLLVLLVISPFFTYLADAMSFPIRLQLSQWTASMMVMLGHSAVAEGNVIVVDGFRMSVDPACMGLRMLDSSLLIGCMMLAYREHRSGGWVNLPMLALASLILIFLAVLANLGRINLLVLFKLMPTDVMHSLIGLVCQVVYVLVPFYFLSKYFVRSKPLLLSQRLKVRPNWFRSALLVFVLLALQAAALIYLQKPSKQPVLQSERLDKAGLIGSFQGEGIYKFHNDTILLYIKSGLAPYKSTHDPRVCWRGSGYEFKAVRTIDHQGTRVYTARLERDQDVLYAMWWYQSGDHRTIDEWDWRWRSVRRGETYRMVNINAASPADLSRFLAANPINF